MPVSTVTLSDKTITCKVHFLMTEELDYTEKKKKNPQNWQSKSPQLLAIREKGIQR